MRQDAGGTEKRATPPVKRSHFFLVSASNTVNGPSQYLDLLDDFW